MGSISDVDYWKRLHDIYLLLLLHSYIFHSLVLAAPLFCTSTVTKVLLWGLSIVDVFFHKGYLDTFHQLDMLNHLGCHATSPHTVRYFNVFYVIFLISPFSRFHIYFASNFCWRKIVNFAESVTLTYRYRWYSHMCQGLNSHYFHIIRHGHQPNSRALYTHHKDSRH